MSCSHYLRKCKLWTPCCNKEYMCRICHDEKEDHSLDRRTVQNIICVQCNKKQEVGRNCNECGILFGQYTCITCRLFDDHDKDQFHCAGCGICRVGGREHFFHCPKCNICISNSIQETHKCVEDMSRRKCPVCLEDLHSSRKGVDIPACSHMIHKECLTKMLSHGKTSCPICNHSLVDMKMVWESIDNTIRNTAMPDIYRNYHVNVLCRDCHQESKVVFHVIGLKCCGCGGYNTTRIGGDEPPPEEAPIVNVESLIVNVESLSVNSDDSFSSLEPEEDGTIVINASDSDVSVTILPNSDENSPDIGNEILEEITDNTNIEQNVVPDRTTHQSLGNIDNSSSNIED